MGRKCSICRRGGHNARTCPRKDRPAAQTAGSEKRVPKVPLKGTKYPLYFYENAPSWVYKLDKGNVRTSPTVVGGTQRYCGNCKNLTENRGFAGEPFCSVHDAAVRGHWYCSKWKRGDIAQVNLVVLGLDV
jgi:hypothetical protein|tara:strand:+ start:791 stop:1183 length:393 start_codon:yes stop_codon:yes gene_type:complete